MTRNEGKQNPSLDLSDESQWNRVIGECGSAANPEGDLSFNSTLTVSGARLRPGELEGTFCPTCNTRFEYLSAVEVAWNP